MKTSLKTSIWAAALAAAGFAAWTAPRAQDAPAKPQAEEPQTKPDDFKAKPDAPLTTFDEPKSKTILDKPQPKTILDEPKLKPTEMKSAPGGSDDVAPDPNAIRNQYGGVQGSDWPMRYRTIADPRVADRYASAIAAYQAAAAGQEKETTKAELRLRLVEVFDADMKLRKEQTDQIEARLTKLREQYQSREAAKDAIIDLQIQVLEKDASGLGFPSPPRAGNPNDAEGLRRYPLLPYSARLNNGQLLPGGWPPPGWRSEVNDEADQQKKPLEQLRKEEPAVVGKLTKAGHFVESKDGKFYAYVNVNFPNGPSLIHLVDSASGKLHAKYHLPGVSGKLQITDEDIVTVEKDGSTTQRIRHAGLYHPTLATLKKEQADYVSRATLDGRFIEAPRGEYYARAISVSPSGRWEVYQVDSATGTLLNRVPLSKEPGRLRITSDGIVSEEFNGLILLLIPSPEAIATYKRKEMEGKPNGNTSLLQPPLRKWAEETAPFFWDSRQTTALPPMGVMGQMDPPLAGVKRVSPNLIDWLAPTGHFVESSDGKYYAYANHFTPQGPSEIRLVDSQDGRLMGYARLTELAGKLRFTEEGLATEEKDGALKLQVAYPKSSRSLSGSTENNRPGLSGSVPVPARAPREIPKTRPLAELKKEQPGQVEELTKAGHFAESTDGKYYTYANSNRPSGPSEIFLVNAADGELLVIWTMEGVPGKLRFTVEGVATEETDGSTRLRIAYPAPAKRSAGEAEKNRPAFASKISTANVANAPPSETTAQGGAFAEYEMLRDLFRGASNELNGAQRKLREIVQQGERSGESKVGAKNKADEQATRIKLLQSPNGRFYEAERMLDTKLNLLQIDLKEAEIAMQDAKTTLQKSQDINSKKPGQVNEAAIRSQKLKLDSAQLQVERAKAMLALFASIKDGPPAASSEASTPSNTPRSETPAQGGAYPAPNATSSQSGVVAEYQSLRSQYQDAKKQLLTADDIQADMDRQKKERGDGFTEEISKAWLEHLKLASARRQSQFDDANRLLEAKLSLLKLDVEEATNALQRAEANLRDAQEKKDGGTLSANAVDQQMGLVRAAQLQIQRAKTIFDLFESIKATPPATPKLPSG